MDPVGFCLIFYVGFYNVERRAAAGRDEVSGRPEGLTPEFFEHLGKASLPYGMGCGPLEALCDLREAKSRRVVNHDVQMIAVRFDCSDIDFHCRGRLLHGFSEGIEDPAGENAPPVFCAEDKVGV